LVLRAGILGALALGLAGCFESDEERAADAYAAYDFETAHRLAEKIAHDGNPRGYELLALMAAQGLGRPIDYSAAFTLAEKAAALNADYADTRDIVDDHIKATAEAAQAAFDAEDYERAYALAEPLAKHGLEPGVALRKTLITGNYVALPGSDMSWRTFWNTCSGNTRFDTNERSNQAFIEQCGNRKAVWDGTVVRTLNGEAYVRMTPGRPGARHDLTLRLAGEAPAELMKPGSKVRFGGVIAERGTPARPDILIEARLSEPAPLTDDESRRVEIDKVRAVMRACQELAEARFRETYMPDWAAEVEAKVRAGGSPRSRAFSLFVGVVSEADVFERTEDGGWRGVWSGTVTIQSVVARTAQVTNFTADCQMDPLFKRGALPEDHGALDFVSISEPVVASAPGRLQTPRRGD
jgi:hypothetical protein